MTFLFLELVFLIDLRVGYAEETAHTDLFIIFFKFSPKDMFMILGREEGRERKREGRERKREINVRDVSTYNPGICSD